MYSNSGYATLDQLNALDFTHILDGLPQSGFGLGSAALTLDKSAFTQKAFLDGKRAADIFQILNYAKFELLPRFELYIPNRVYPQTLPDGTWDSEAYYKNNTYKNESESDYYARRYKEMAEYYDGIITYGNDTYTNLQRLLNDYSRPNPFQRFEFYTATGGKLISKAAGIAASGFVAQAAATTGAAAASATATAATLSAVAASVSVACVYVAAFFVFVKTANYLFGFDEDEKRLRISTVAGAETIIKNGQKALETLDVVAKQYEDKIKALKQAELFKPEFKPKIEEQTRNAANPNNWLGIVFIVIMLIALYKLATRKRTRSR